MKRFILVLVAIGVMGMFAACKKDDKKKEGGDEAAKPTETATDEAKPDEATPEGDEAAPEGDEAAPEGDEAAAADGEGVGIAECDTYIKRVMACEKFPQQGKDALSGSLDAWKQAKAGGDEAVKAAGEACKKAEEAADQALKAMGC